MKFLMFLLTFTLSYQVSAACDFYTLEEAVMVDDLQELRIQADICPEMTTLRNVSDQTLLHIATEFDALESMSFLMNSGARTNATDDRGVRPLHQAQSIEAAKLLLDRKAELNIRDRYGRTPFSTALERKNFELMEYLLSQGAHVQVNDVKWAAEKYEFEALEFVTARVERKHILGSGRYFRAFFFYEPSFRKLAEKLVAVGADLNQAVTVSSRRSLLDFYVNEYVKNESGFQKHGTVAIEWLADYGADVNAYMPRLGNSIFHGIFWRSDLEINKKLTNVFLKNGLDINHSFASDNHKNVLMKIPFHRSDKPGHKTYLKEITTFLVSKGANPDQQSNDGRTPLHWAVRWANSAVVEILAPVSDIRLRDDQGFTALEYARVRLRETPMLWEKKELSRIIKLLR